MRPERRQRVRVRQLPRRVVIHAREIESPAASNVGAACERSRLASTSATHAGGCLPLPTKISACPSDCAPCGAEMRSHRNRTPRNRRAFDVERAQLAHRRARLALARAKRAEIVLADEEPRRFAHALDVERQMKPSDPAMIGSGPHRTVEQHISVAPTACRIARVKLLRTSRAHNTASPAGRLALTPRHHADSGRRTGASKCTTCSSACTPASVRPAQTVSTGSPAISASAASRRSCTPHPEGCVCHPQKRPRHILRPSEHSSRDSKIYAAPSLRSGRNGPLMRLAALRINKKPRQGGCRGWVRDCDCGSAERPQQLLRLRLLLWIAFLQHFLEDVARSVLVAHFLVGFGEIELLLDVVPVVVLSQGRAATLAAETRD